MSHIGSNTVGLFKVDEKKLLHILFGIPRHHMKKYYDFILFLNRLHGVDSGGFSESI